MGHKPNPNKNWNKALSNFPKIKNRIDTEFKQFRAEICNSPAVYAFDRAQEILIKTSIADEILHRFPETEKSCRDDEDFAATILTIYKMLPKEKNLLQRLYEDYIEDIPALLDPGILGDYIYDNYCLYENLK